MTPTRRVLLVALVLGGTATGTTAQVPAGVPRVGILFLGVTGAEAVRAGGTADEGNSLESGMRALGYVEGRNVIFERRDAQGRPERLDGLAAELVRAKVDVIVAGGPGPLAAARRASTTLPIVTVGGSDPVQEGWAGSLARPGGNVTGLTVTYPELSPKRLELIKELAPASVRIGLLLNPAEVSRAEMTGLLEEPARRLGMEIHVLEVHSLADMEPVLNAARRDRIEAVLSLDTPLILSNQRRLGDLMLKLRLPWMGEFTTFGTHGLLLAYGADIRDLLRRSAAHVDRILKGTRPGDLPIERPTKLDLTINLQTARALGIVVPPSLVRRADRMIE